MCFRVERDCHLVKIIRWLHTVEFAVFDGIAYKHPSDGLYAKKSAFVLDDRLLLDGGK